jgi:hypothetical protein
MHAYIHTYIRTYIHTYIHMQTFLRAVNAIHVRVLEELTNNSYNQTNKRTNFKIIFLQTI